MAFQDIGKRDDHLGTEVVPELLLCEGLAGREGGRGILDLRLVYVVMDNSKVKELLQDVLSKLEVVKIS